MALVTVTDTLLKNDGEPDTGRITVANDTFIDSTGAIVAGSSVTYTIEEVDEGEFTIPVYSTEDASPAGVSYKVHYQLSTETYDEIWVVPAGGPHTLEDVRVSVSPTPDFIGPFVRSLGGLSENAQTLAIGSTGTAPNWVSSGSTHTLHIPMASAASVTAGLLTKAKYDAFDAKQAAVSTSGAVANQFVTGFTAPNTFTRAQPAFTDISGVATPAQLPAASAVAAGAVTTGTQTLAGAKTFSGEVVTQANLKVQVVATGSLPAAGAGMDGTVLIEDAGAGDRNIIVYAAGQRFRIDGGGNV